MKRRKTLKIALGSFLAAAAAVVIWQRPWAGRGGSDLTFDTVAVDQGAIQAKVTASGTLSPRKNVQVGAQVSGRIIELDADFNDHVKKDQIIAKLDPRGVEAQIAQNRANLQAARASLTKAQVQLTDATRQRTRQEALRAQNLVAVTAVEAAEVTEDTARASVTSARAQIAQAQASLEQAQLDLTYATIKSPVDGVVISRDVDVGQTVAASLSAPTLFTIAEDLARMQIDTSVAEGDVGALASGMKADFTVDAFPERTFTGTVRQIRNAATTVSGVVTYDAVIDVDNPDGALRPGMTANVTFILHEVDKTIRVPNAALRFKPTPAQRQALFASSGKGSGSGRPGRGSGAGRRGGSGSGSGSSGGRGGQPSDPTRKMVWKLDAATGQVTAVRIKVGLTDGSKTQLVEGELAAGDKLVTAITGAAPTTTGGGRAGGPMRF
jgi:HlyD family secretion protein